LLILLVLLSACVLEEDEDVTVIGDAEDSGATYDLTDSELPYDLPFSLDEVYGETAVEFYTATLSDEIVTMKSTRTDEYGYELDLTSTNSYEFTLVRVYFLGGTSNFYVVDVTGSMSYEYVEESEDIEDGSYITTTIGPVSGSFTEEINEIVRVIQVEEDGEFWFYLAPGYVTEDWSEDTVKTITYSYDSSMTEVEDKTIDYSGVSVGGGYINPCAADLSDEVLQGASSCKVYLGEDSSGTYQDSYYQELEDGFSNKIWTAEWEITSISDIYAVEE